MYENGHIQTVTKDFSKRREQEPSISGTFVRLNMLDYKKTRWSDQRYSYNSDSIVLRQVACSKVVRN